MDEKKNELFQAFDDLGQAYRETAAAYEIECEAWWQSLSEEDRLKAFYAVIKRVSKGELEDRGSYRYILYQVFGFGPEAYSIGMECGFLDLHNAIEPLDA